MPISRNTRVILVKKARCIRNREPDRHSQPGFSQALNRSDQEWSKQSFFIWGSRMWENFAIMSPSLLETNKIIINVSKIALLDTNFVLHFLHFYSSKILHCVQFESTFQISNYKRLINFWLYSSSGTLIIYFRWLIVFLWSLDSLCQGYKSTPKSTVCLMIWRWEANTSLHYLTLKERIKLLLTCVGIHAKLKQKKRMKHSSIEWRSNSPMSHDIFCMILDLWRRTAGELISWHSSSGEWGCSLYF